MGFRVAFQRGLGRRVISWAAAAVAWCISNIPAARAAGDGGDEVVVACPELAEARAAELEARARATLLTNDLSATVAISCVSEGVVVRVDAGGDSVTLKLRVGPASLREEVLRALDRALADLRARVAPDGQTGGPSSPPSPGTDPPRSGLEPDVREAPQPTPSAVVTPAPPSPSRPSSARSAEVGAHLLGESWGTAAALGGGFGAALRLDSTWRCGIRAAALHPLALDEATVLEGHVLAEATYTARALAGLRFGVGVGPSLLFVSPNSGFFVPGTTLRSTVRLEARLSRPFRFGWMELSPWLGIRAFTAERGVRVARQARLVVGGVLPQIGLALSFGDAEPPGR